MAQTKQPPGKPGRFIFGAVQPGTDAGFALVLPEASTVAMNIFLSEFSKSLPGDVHAVMVLDRAGWHGAKAIEVPENITLVPLPPYSPELNPIERVWLFLKERHLSLRLFDDTEAIVDACCKAWNNLVNETGRIKSLCNQPWIRKVSS